MPKIDGLGRFRSPLGTARLNGTTKLIVSPWAAIVTDGLLIGAGLTALIAAKPTALKVLGGVSTLWGTVALGLEVIKLYEDQVMINDAAIQRQ